MIGELPLKVFLAGRVALETDGVVIDEERFQGRSGVVGCGHLTWRRCLVVDVEHREVCHEARRRRPLLADKVLSI